MSKDNTLIQSYVSHDGKRFFISTIDRESSSPLGGRYAETMVWRWDKGDEQRGEMLSMHDDMRGSIRTHQAVESAYFSFGRIPDDEADK